MSSLASLEPSFSFRTVESAKRESPASSEGSKKGEGEDKTDPDGLSASSSPSVSSWNEGEDFAPADSKSPSLLSTLDKASDVWGI